MKTTVSTLRLSALWLTLALAGSLAAQDRVMFGDDIYVGPNEVLQEVVCIFCSVRIEGKAKTVVAIVGSVRIDGEVADEAVAILGGIDVRGAIRGEAVAVLGGIKSSGTIGGDAVSVLGGLESSGTIGGDAVAVLGGIELAPGARVEGDTVAVLSGVKGAADAEIIGDVQESEALRSLVVSAFVVAALIFLIFGLALCPFLTFVAVSILGDRRVETVAQTVNQRAGMCFLLGLGVFIGSFIFSILISIAMFWLPAAELMVGLAFFVTAVVGYAGVGLWVGRGLVKTGSATGAAVLGSIIVTVVQLIPIIGWFLLWPIFGLMALGAAVLSGYGTSVDWLLRRTETDPIARPALR